MHNFVFHYMRFRGISREPSLVLMLCLVFSLHFSLSFWHPCRWNKGTCCCSTAEVLNSKKKATWRRSKFPRFKRLPWRVFAKSVRTRPLATPTIVASAAFLVESSSGVVCYGQRSTFAKATKIALWTWLLDPIVSTVGFRNVWGLAWTLQLSNLPDRKESLSNPSWTIGNLMIHFSNVLSFLSLGWPWPELLDSAVLLCMVVSMYETSKIYVTDVHFLQTHAVWKITEKVS